MMMMLAKSIYLVVLAILLMQGCFCVPVYLRSCNVRRVLCLINTERVLHGLHPLSLHHQFMEAAYKHSKIQAKYSVMTHSDPAGRLGRRMDRMGFEWHSVGENVASGYHSEDDVVRAWMKSPPHRKNILNPHSVFLGIANVQGYWTQEFGCPLDLKFAAEVAHKAAICPPLSSLPLY